jgi:hypothetical protein
MPHLLCLHLIRHVPRVVDAAAIETRAGCTHGIKCAHLPRTEPPDPPKNRDRRAMSVTEISRVPMVRPASGHSEQEREGEAANAYVAA